VNRKTSVLWGPGEQKETDSKSEKNTREMNFHPEKKKGGMASVQFLPTTTLMGESGETPASVSRRRSYDTESREKNAGGRLTEKRWIQRLYREQWSLGTIKGRYEYCAKGQES